MKNTALTSCRWVPCSLMIALVGGQAGEQAQSRSDLVLWYDKPAVRWEQEALPIGNGYMGAMIFGGVEQERIQFNEESLWVGDEEETGAYQAFGNLFIFMDGAKPQWPQVSSPSDPGESVAYSCDEQIAPTWTIEKVAKFPVVWQAMIPYAQKEPLTSYRLKTVLSPTEMVPKSWRFLGSQDGTNWTLLDQRTFIVTEAKKDLSGTFKFTNQTVYTYYRFEFLETQGGRSFALTDVALGSLPLSPYLDLPQNKADVVASNYRRELDIGRAVHTVSYEKNGVKYRRDAFASYPARVMAVRFTADKPGALTGAVVLTDMHNGTIRAEDGGITVAGSLAGYPRGNTYFKMGLNYAAQLRVLNEGGSVRIEDNKITVEHANSMTLLLAAGTDYVPDRRLGWKGESPKVKIAARLDAAAKRSWDDLLTEHVRDYQSLFNRVSLDLGSGPAVSLPTDVRLEAYRKSGASDPQLEALLFQHGRYLMIASSRPGGLPANLQGKWNRANNPPWRCDYHTDINVQMNYWPVEPISLPECFQPYSDWVESIRAVLTERTRKESKKRGWVMGAESGIFGGTTAMGYLGTSSWVLMNSYEHYLFTGDKNYLRTRVYPAMKEVCEYWFDSLIEQPDGTLLTPKSHSPEHGPSEVGISFDRQQVWELFSNTIEASQALGVDEELCRKLSDMKARLLPPKVGSWGQLMEWKTEIKDPSIRSEGGAVDTLTNRHRHISHLIGVFPGRQISPIKTPELAAAARVSLNARGDKATGWSAAHKMNVWARLQEGERAYALARLILSDYTMPNMFTMHPPFQIDANFGYSSGICEMLVQSHERTGATSVFGCPEMLINLLPAVPKAWPSGSVKGLKARGGYTVDMEWLDGKVKAYRIVAGESADPKLTVKVRINNDVKDVKPAIR